MCYFEGKKCYTLVHEVHCIVCRFSIIDLIKKRSGCPVDGYEQILPFVLHFGQVSDIHVKIPWLISLEFLCFLTFLLRRFVQLCCPQGTIDSTA